MRLTIRFSTILCNLCLYILHYLDSPPHKEFISKTSFNSMDSHTQFNSPSYSVTKHPKSLKIKSINALTSKSKSKKLKQKSKVNNVSESDEEIEIKIDSITMTCDNNGFN